MRMIPRIGQTIINQKIEKRMKFKITVVVALFAMLATNAQMKKWTLQECVTFAVENNLTIEQFELDLENAKIDKSDAIGNFLPNFNVVGLCVQ